MPVSTLHTLMESHLRVLARKGDDVWHEGHRGDANKTRQRYRQRGCRWVETSPGSVSSVPVKLLASISPDSTGPPVFSDDVRVNVIHLRNICFY